jgi:hypothetical protein
MPPSERPHDIMQTVAKSTDPAVIPEIRELLAHIHRNLGGSEALAKTLVDDLKDSPKGIRLSFYSSYLTAIAKFGGTADLATYTQADLEREGTRLMKAEKQRQAEEEEAARKAKEEEAKRKEEEAPEKQRRYEIGQRLLEGREAAARRRAAEGNATEDLTKEEGIPCEAP